MMAPGGYLLAYMAWIQPIFPFQAQESRVCRAKKFPQLHHRTCFSLPEEASPCEVLPHQ